jgi:S1-C subfamily serine protease
MVAGAILLVALVAGLVVQPQPDCQALCAPRMAALVLGGLIVAVDDKPVDSVARLLAVLDDYKLGDSVRITVLRDGQKRQVTVKLQPGR